MPQFAVRCRDELGWTAALVDVGGGFGVRHVVDDPRIDLEALARAVADAVSSAWSAHGLAAPRLALEPGRALVGRAGVTLYRVALGEATRPGRAGSLSTEACPTIRGRSSTTRGTRRWRATRADEPATENVSVAGLHCESGDVLIDDVVLPPPRVGDLLAVPATGAYTLAMSSNYNATPRPAAVLVRDGDARLIRRRETVDDLLAAEV